jgi:hypothetical protein
MRRSLNNKLWLISRSLSGNKSLTFPWNRSRSYSGKRSMKWTLSGEMSRSGNRSWPGSWSGKVSSQCSLSELLSSSFSGDMSF